MVENNDAERDLKLESDNLEFNRLSTAEAVSINERDLRGQIARIKETIHRMLKIDKTLGEQIKTLFREQGITVVSILSAISLAIVASIVASLKPILTPVPPPPIQAPPTPGSGGVKECIQKLNKIYRTC